MRSVFLNFLNTLILTFFSLAIFAQPSEDGPITNLGTIINDGEGTLPRYAFCLDENDDLIVKTNILLGSLEVMGNPPDQYGVIPSTFPDMFIEYTINGEVLDPVPMGNFDIVQLGNGYTAFSFIAQSPPINYSDECNVVALNETYISASVSYRLVTPVQGGTGWDVYPACDYAYDSGMFSCNVYTWAPWCNAVPSGQGFIAGPTDPTPTCYDEWFSGFYSAQMYCNCETDPEPGPTHEDDKVVTGNESIDDNGSGIKNRFVLEDKVSVYPNPMENSLFIESKSSIIKEVELYNSRGDLIIMNKYNQSEIQSVRLNTSELPNGLYLVRITTNTGYEVIKVLK